jgi:hypothetical protein
MPHVITCCFASHCMRCCIHFAVLRIRRHQWGTAPQIDRVANYSVGTSTLIAILGHCVYSPRGKAPMRRIAAKVLRDFVNSNFAKFQLTRTLFLPFSDDEWCPVAMASTKLELVNVQCPHEFLVFFQMWDNMVAHDAVDDMVVTNACTRPSVGEFVAALLLLAPDMSGVTADVVFRVAMSVLSQIANVLQANVMQIVCGPTASALRGTVRSIGKGKVQDSMRGHTCKDQSVHSCHRF